MGVGHLDIGTGIGGAQVFNPLPAVQMYGQVLAQRKAKQDADNKYLADTLAKGYDPSGLRNDADRQAYVKQYSDIKQQAIDSENEKDPMKKALALAQVRQQLGDLGNFADQSKKQGANEHAWAQSYMQNPNNWGEDALNAYRKSKDAAIGSDGVINDFTTLQRRVDPDKVDKMYQSHKDLVTKNMQYDNGTQTPATVAGKKGAYVVQTRGIPMDGDNGAFETTLHWATSQPDVQKSLQDRYPAIQADSPQATLGLRVRQYMNDMGDKDGIYDQTKPVFKEGIQPQRYTLEQQWFLKHYGVPYNPNPPGQVVSNQPTPAQTLATQMQNQVPGSGEKFVSLAPSGQYGGAHIGIGVNKETGTHDFSFPAHIDEKAVAYNKVLKDKWNKEHPGEDYSPKVFGFSKLKQETTAPAKIYNLNPASPDYLAQFAQMAKEQNINLSQLNQIEGIKGGHGQVQQAQGNKTQSFLIKGKQFKSDAVLKAAQASGMTVDEYLKRANKN